MRYKVGKSLLTVTESLLGRSSPIPFVVQGPYFYHGIASHAYARKEARKYKAFGLWRVKKRDD